MRLKPSNKPPKIGDIAKIRGIYYVIDDIVKERRQIKLECSRNGKQVVLISKEEVDYTIAI